MAGNTGNGWRMAIWGGAALLLLLPLVAMQLTQEVKWTGFDFAVVGALLLAACGTYELAARMTGNTAYRAAVGVAIAAALLLVWVNLAVGIVGTEDNPANLMFGGVLAVGIVGALSVRFQPEGMARALVATAVIQALTAAIVLVAGHPYEAFLTLFWVAMWLASAWLFRRAAREQSPAGAAQR
jgi:hypothetical protein